VSTQHKQSFFQRYLDPGDRLDELLFGLIMVLSITLGVGLATDEGGSTLQVAVTIFGCNLAWGLIDGIMYVVMQLFDRSRKAQLIEALRSTNSDAEKVATVGGVLDDELSPLTTEDERRALYLDISRRLGGVTIQQTRVAAEDVYGALAIVWLVVLTSVPAVLPFLLIADRFVAARVSNALVLMALFAVGFGFARTIHANPWTVGMSTAVLGIVLVGVVMLLGG
jgi:VIT1/CCC1 family predicted Fe2+/Mn2+ transporter